MVESRAAISRLLREYCRDAQDRQQVVVLWGPSGMGKTWLVQEFVKSEQSLAQASEGYHPTVLLDLADNQLIDSFSMSTEFYMQLRRSHRSLRLPRFELLWACLGQRRRFGQLAKPRGSDAVSTGNETIDIASAWLGDAAHIPFVGSAAATTKLLLRAGGYALNRHEVARVTDWFVEHLAPTEGSLQNALESTDTLVLEKLLAPGLAVDVAAAASRQRITLPLVVAVDRYESLTYRRGMAGASSFPGALCAQLSAQGVPSLFLLASQNPVREWRAFAVPQDHFHSFELPPFSRDETTFYLRGRGISEPALVRRLHEVSGGTPAILAAIADLHRDERVTSDWTTLRTGLDELKERLAARDLSSDESARVIMDWFTEHLRLQLAAEDQVFFELLVSAAGLRTFNVETLAAVAQDPSMVRPALRALMRYSFLQPAYKPTIPEGSPDRYRVHELFARSIMLSDVYRERMALTHQRAADYFKLEGPVRSDDDRRRIAEHVYHLTALDEARGLSEAERVAQGPGSDDLALLDYVVDALRDLPRLAPANHARALALDARRHRAHAEYGAAVALLEEASRIEADWPNLTALRVRILCGLAECERLLGDTSGSDRAWSKVRELGLRSHDPAAEFFGLEGLLRSALDADDLIKAREYAAQASSALERLERLNSHVFPELNGEALELRKGHLFRQLSRLARFSGDYLSGFEYAQNALVAYGRRGSQGIQAWARITRGHSSRSLGRVAEAIEDAKFAYGVFAGAPFDEGQLEESISHPGRKSDPLGYSKALQLMLLGLLSDVALQHSDPTPAPLDPAVFGAVYGIIADALLHVNDRHMVDPFAPMYSHYAQGEQARLCGDDSSAEEHFQSAIRVCRARGGRVEAAYSLISLADMYRTRGRNGEATEKAREALEAGRVSGYPWIVLQSALELALMLESERESFLKVAREAVAQIRYAPEGPSLAAERHHAVSDLLQGDSRSVRLTFVVP